MNKFLPKDAIFNSSGIISPLILIGVAAVLVLFVVLGNLPIRDRLFGGLFPKQFSNASGASANLNLLPASTTVAPNTTFTVDVALGPESAAVSGVQADIVFDPTKLKATDIKIGNVLAQPLDPCTFQLGVCTVPFVEAIKYTDASKTTQTGVIHFEVGAKTGDPFVTSPAQIATITFQALALTTVPSQVTFNAAATAVAGADPVTGQGIAGDIKGDLTPSAITISNSPAVVKTADFSLTAPSSIAAGSQFNVVVKAKSPEAANLFVADLNFNPALLGVVSISTTGSFITQWVNDNTFNNTTGTINLVGGVPTPGFSATTASTIATVVFQAKVAGTAPISFGANSAIYRNSDNVNVLITPVTGASVNITGVAPSPSPSVAPSPSPAVSPSPAASVAPSASPSAAPSTAPSASPVASATPAASASPTATPSPSAVPVACAITGANWVTSANPVTQGKVVGLSVTGSGNCAGQSVSFTVLEDDNILGVIGGTDPVKNNPPTTKFNSSNIATSNWLAEYQDDPVLIASNIPEYFFVAQLSSGLTATSANPELQVMPLTGGSFLTGDANKDGVVDLIDLSILLSNWNKTANFIDTLDLNQDGGVNAVDWATMIQILKVTQIIK